MKLFSIACFSVFILGSSRISYGADNPCEGYNPASGDYSNCMAGEKHKSKKKGWEKRVTLVEGRLSSDGKKALETLRKQAAIYFDLNAEVSNFASAGGTAYASYIESTLMALNERMVTQMEEMGKKALPKASKEDVAGTDKELNRAYSNALARCRKDEKSWGERLAFGRSCNKVKEMQRAWIPYRDAWIQLYQATNVEKSASQEIERTALRGLSKDQAVFLSSLEYE